MRNLLIGSVALAAASLGGPALAADMPLKAPPPVVVYNWTGCYLGLSIGTNTGRARHTETAASFFAPGAGGRAGVIVPGQDITDPFNLSGLMGGAQGGCNYQFAGGWVIGVEVDWSVTNKEGQRDEGAIGFGAAPFPG